MKSLLKLLAISYTITACSFGQLIPLTTANVVGGSGSWVQYGTATWDGTGTIDAGVYPASRVLDQQSGTVFDNNVSAPFTYWLAPTGATNAFFVIDLGAPYFISEIDLFNTNNAGYGD